MADMTHLYSDRPNYESKESVYSDRVTQPNWVYFYASSPPPPLQQKELLGSTEESGLIMFKSLRLYRKNFDSAWPNVQRPNNSDSEPNSTECRGVALSLFRFRQIHAEEFDVALSKIVQQIYAVNDQGELYWDQYDKPHSFSEAVQQRDF
jgi:hypothetical protein